jgi:hypothetical protein
MHLCRHKGWQRSPRLGWHAGMQSVTKYALFRACKPQDCNCWERSGSRELNYWDQLLLASEGRRNWRQPLQRNPFFPSASIYTSRFLPQGLQIQLEYNLRKKRRSLQVQNFLQTPCNVWVNYEEAVPVSACRWKEISLSLSLTHTHTHSSLYPSVYYFHKSRQN